MHNHSNIGKKANPSKNPKFAPPSQYTPAKQHNQFHKKKPTSTENTSKIDITTPPPPMGFNPTVPPPSSHSRQEPEFDPDEPLPPGYEPQEPQPGPSNSRVSLEERLHLHEQFNPTPIRNEIDQQYEYDESDDEEETEKDFVRNRGTEIPPPCSQEYYSSSNQKSKERRKGLRTHEQMAESFLCGLNSHLNKNKSKNDDSDEDDSD